MTHAPLTPDDTVFITGVTGFIGRRVALAAADAGYRVVGLHRAHTHRTDARADLAAHDGIELRTGDLHDPSGLRGHLRATRPAAICHFGALTRVAYSFDHAEEVHAVNATGTLALAEAARDAVPGLEKFLFASSMEVYGNIQPAPLSPDLSHVPVYEITDVPQPAAPYAAAKLSAESHLNVLAEAFGFPAVSLRQTNCYGREHNAYFVVEAFATALLDAVDGGPAPRLGDPRPYRNFIHIDDLVDLYLTLLDSDTADLHGAVYNTGPPNALQIRDLYARLADRVGYDGEAHWYTREVRPGEVWCLNSDHARLTDATGWQPTVNLDEGLDRVIETWR